MPSMSMYRELLSLSLASTGEPTDDGTVDHLLDEARLARVRARGGPRGAEDSVEGDVARELDYDLALVRLCRAAGTPVDLDGFVTPARERERLEQCLRERGLDVAADE